MRMTGHVDTERRPLLRVELPDGEPILALIDTGFDGTLAFSEADAIACGVDIDPYYRDEVFVIGRRPVSVGYGELRIRWMGRDVEVGVVVDLNDPRRTVNAREPVAIIGTKLLSPSALTVDFGGRTVLIEGSDA